MAFLGRLKVTATAVVYGWACDYCGLNAESYEERQPPKEWYSSEKYTVNISPLTYTNSSLYCSKRCCAIYNGRPWPPLKEPDPFRRFVGSLDKAPKIE